MGKVYVNISIDTENMNTLFYNKKYSKSILRIGTQQIIDILNKYNVTATFFLSIFESYNISHDEMKKVSQLIEPFEVGLHTHPLWIDKENMHSYSLSKQVKLIKKGIDLFIKFGLKKPKVHRAGAYGLNKDTLQALKDNNILIDSSMFYSHPNCKEIWSKNKVVKKNDIIEFPVTIFRRNMYDLNNNLISDKIVKTDLNSMFYDEFIQFIEYCKEGNIKYINLFMHSYSLLKFNDGKFTKNIRDETKLHRILKYIINDKNIEVITLEQLQYKDLDKINNDELPVIKRVFNENIKNEDNY